MFTNKRLFTIQAFTIGRVHCTALCLTYCIFLFVDPVEDKVRLAKVHSSITQPCKF